MLHKLSERKIKVPVGLVFLLRKKKKTVKQNLKIITFCVNDFEQRARRTASWLASRDRRILTTLHYINKKVW